MDTTTFDEELSALASSLGDATRRGIYISVREAAEPATASQIASIFNLHTNVARHHLDKLVTDGYLRVTHKRRPGKQGPGAGRPAKHYEPTPKEVSVQYPARRYDLLSELLLRIVERLDTAQAGSVAEEIGVEFRRELASEIGLPNDAGFDSAVKAVASAMTGVGVRHEHRRRRSHDGYSILPVRKNGYGSPRDRLSARPGHRTWSAGGQPSRRDPHRDSSSNAG